MFRGLMVVAALLWVALCSGGVGAGVIVFNDGSFSYQGYMEEDGEPANGMYSFRFEAFNEPVGPGIASEFLFFSEPVPVVDGLFVVNVQMGGSLENAQQFWRTVGNQDMYLEIGVGLFEGGPYETLGTRVPMGWGARAQYSGFSEALIFPYADSFTDEFFDPTTMVSLTSVAGGTVLELITMNNTDEPVLSILGEDVFGSDYGFQNGALRIDAMNEPVGALISGGQYGLVSLLEAGAPFAETALIAQVNNGVNAVALTAINQETNTFATLASATRGAEIGGDVLARDELRVQGEALRDYASNSPSPIGPLAYASINSSGSVSAGTANVSSVWNAGSERYEITIAGESVTFQTHVIIANVVDLNSPRVATVNAAGGVVLVKIWNLNGTNDAIQDNFQLVVYDPAVTVLSRNAAPGGVDLDRYIEQTGEVMIRTAPRHEPVEDGAPVPFGQ